MSLIAVRWAQAQTAPTSSAKFVLTMLALAVNEAAALQTGEFLAWPSVAALCDSTQMDRKTIIAATRGLEDAGLISRAGTAGRTNQVIRWRLPVGGTEASTENGTGTNSGTGTESGTVPNSAPVPFFPPNSTVFPSDQSQKRDTEQEGNTKGTTERVRATRSPAADRGCRLPADWTLPTEGREWALSQRPDLDPDATAERFADYWHAQPGAKGRRADWPATWRNWVRNERPAAHPARRGPLHSDDNLAVY